MSPQMKTNDAQVPFHTVVPFLRLFSSVSWGGHECASESSPPNHGIEKLSRQLEKLYAVVTSNSRVTVSRKPLAIDRDEGN
ncbi:Hypothetical protein NTJ_02866 [Nesidiocoris tenuis]|uniref:Uncharacterized protein n=1 Tax=Nesidiocoris tenuis TaxID=355587 RepID=A0ABN7ACN5_9HEMI|nr:Hypothetical protein NTJ_02866 [Nesidiocoris tenuis]